MTELYESSNLAQMVEKQWKKWLLLAQQRRQEEELRPAPTVTISRERGSGGSSIGRRVAERLHFVFFDSEIVDYVARSASVDRLVVSQLDERSQRSIQSRAERARRDKEFSPQSYMDHLTRTILTIGEKGRAVIVGRGAHLILPAESCFRVRVIAPQPVRIQRLVTGSKMAWPEAEQLVTETDRQRAQFIQEHFQKADADPALYDLVINTGRLDIETAAELICRAVEACFPQARPAPAAGGAEPTPPAVPS